MVMPRFFRQQPWVIEWICPIHYTNAHTELFICTIQSSCPLPRWKECKHSVLNSEDTMCMSVHYDAICTAKIEKL